MDAGTMVGLLVAVLAFVLGTWGASLVVRALASRASRFSPRWRRRVPKPLHITPPKLSRLQFWFGMLAGPPVFAAGTALALFVAGEVLTERDDINPLFVSGAIVLLMLGLGTMIVGFRWDRANGRRRCPKCWYDYTGLDDLAACPECGRVPRGARSLLRTRRSGLMMRFGAVIMLGAWAAYVAPRAIMTDGRSLIPTTILIGAFERLPERVVIVSGWGSDGSLQARLWDDELTLGQRTWLFKRSARLLETSDDPRICGLAARFLSLSTHVGRGPVPAVMHSDLDAASANMLRVMFKDKSGYAAAAGFEQAGMLSVGPATVRAVEESIDEILARYVTPTSSVSRMAYGRLIARTAPLTPAVFDTVKGVALDPTLSYEDHAAACVVYGMLARRDPTRAAQLEQDFERASGFDREALATAIFASKVEPALVVAGGLLVTTVTDLTDQTLETLKSEDAAVRNGAIAHTSMGHIVHGIGYGSDKLTDAIREVARQHPDSRVRAIQHLALRRDVDQDVVPELVAIAREGSPQDLVVLAGAVAQAWMGVAWIPLYEAVTERVNDPTLDQASRDALGQIQTRMKQSIPSLR